MSVVEAAEEAGAKQFAQLLRGAAIDTQLTEMTDFTLFLPTDEAIEVNTTQWSRQPLRPTIINSPTFY